MSRIEFSVLGPLRIQVDGRPIELGTGRRRTALAALINDAPNVVSLDQLASRIWDDGPPTNPGAAVHTYVSRLRSSLRESVRDGSQQVVIKTEHPGYRLDIDPEQIDAVRFERVLDRARGLVAQDPEQARQLLAGGLDLWRGDAYSDVRAGFAELAAQRLGSLRVTAQEVFVDCELVLGRHEQVIGLAEELVAAQPLREPRHAALMLALYRSGRPAEALSHYEGVRRRLAEELGSDPGKDLRELHERILREDPTLDAPDARMPARRRPEGADPPEDPVGLTDVGPAQPPMAGRARELSRVNEAVRAAWSEPAPLVSVVVGEAGIGKSRLLEETAVVARDEGALVVWGRSWQHEGSPALWPWVQALRDLAHLVEPSVLRAALEDRAAGAARFLQPDRARPASEQPVASSAESLPGDSIESSQVRLFDAITVALERLAGERRIVVILEDMQWADTASRRLLEYLTTHAAGTGLALVVSIRQPTEDTTAASQEVLAALARTGRAVRIPLTGLGPDDLRRYVADRTGSVIDDATADALVERTEGNPFFVGELVRLLVSDRGEPTLPSEVPDSIREVVLRRLQGLSEAELDVLRAAAVVGRTFDLDLLRDIGGAEDELVDEAVDRATAAGFLCSEPNSLDRHRFTHALVQQTLVEELGPMRRRRLHHRIAAVLRVAETGSLDQLLTLIHHLARAGGPANLDEAVGLSLDAADLASARGDHPEVESILLQALDLATRLEPPRGDEREIDVLVRLGALYDYFYGVLHPASAAHRRRARELAHRSTSRHHLVAVLNSAVSNALGAADFTGAHSVLLEMRATGAALDDALLSAGADMSEGMLFLQQGRLEEAVECLSAVVARTGENGLGPRSTLFVTPLEVAVGWRLIANTLRGVSDGTDEDLLATRRLLASEQPAVATHAAGVLALHGVALDDRTTALRFSQRALDLAHETRNQAVALYLPAALAWAHDDAEPSMLESALVPLEQPSRLLMRPLLRSLVADAHLRAGRSVTAKELYQRSLQEAAATGNLLAMPRVEARLGAIG